MVNDALKGPAKTASIPLSLGAGRLRPLVEFRILGPVEAWEGERRLELGSPKQRALLAYLLLHRGEPVAGERLVDDLWDGERPPTAAKTVQVYVSRLRSVLGGGLLLTRGRSYVFEVERGNVDADRFEDLVHSARSARCG